MNRIVFIVPYYGALPVFFREWVFSAGLLGGQDIDFLLITDNQIEFSLPNTFTLADIVLI